MATRCYVALTATPLNTAPVWTDAGRVIGASIRRGRRGNEGPTEPGSADIRIDDPDRRLDPTNPSSPWAADLGPMRQVKIDQVLDDGTTERLFTGFLDDIATSYRPNVSTLRAVDGLAWLGAQRPVADSYGVVVGQAAPYSWWRMDQPVGATVLTDSGAGSLGAYPLNAFALTAVRSIPAPSAIVASAGNALQMPDAENFQAYSPGFSISYTNVFTLGWWVRFSQVPTQELVIYQGGFGNPLEGALNFGVTKAGKAFVRRALNAGGGTTTITNPVVITDGQWHYVNYERNGGTWNVAIDNGAATIGTFGSVTGAGTGTDVIGGGPFWLDEMTFFTRLLTGAEKTNLHLAGRSRWGTAGGGQASGTRVGVVLDQVNWPAAWRSVDAGVEQVGSPTVESQDELVNASALAHLEKVALTEGGRLHCRRDGVLRFAARPATTPAPVASYNNVSGLRFIRARPSRRRADIVNHAEATRPGGVTQVAEDAVSIARYLRHDAPNRDGLWATDTAALAHAQRTVTAGATPRTRIDQLVVNARTGPPEEQAVAQRDLGDTISITSNPPGGTPTTLTCTIEGITHTINTGRQWTTTYDLAPTQP